MNSPPARKSQRRKSAEDRRPAMPPDLKGLACDGARVRTLPFAFFTKRYRPAVVHVAAYLDAMGGQADTCRWDHPGTIAAAIGFRERAVELAFKTLETEGWVRIERQRVGDHDTNVYWLLWRVPAGDSAGPVDERTSIPIPPRKQPTERAQSARTCAPTCAPPSVDPGLSPCASAAPSAEPCAEKAHTCAPPSYKESSIQGEHNDNVTKRPIFSASIPPTATSEPKSTPTSDEIERAKRDLTHRNSMFRRIAANVLSQVGLCPAEFAGLVNKEDVPPTKPAAPSRPQPSTTSEMILALADPASTLAVDLVVDRMTRELDDWNSKPWIRKILGEVRSGALHGGDVAKCFVEAKRQTQKPPKVYFGRGLKQLRSQPSA